MRTMWASPVFKLAIVLLAVISGALVCLWAFRDSLSLIFWRIRYWGTPRGTGTGPREIFPAAKPGGIAVKLAGISEEEWKVSHVWVPATRSVTLSSEKTIITLGCWWDNFGVVTDLPAGSNGAFTNAIKRSVGLAHAPFQIQIAFQARAAAGQLVITPPKIGARGDGYFLVLEVDGVDAGSPVRDTGQTRESHPMFGDGDPLTIETISVSTDGTAARAGDLAVAVFAMDPCDNPDIAISLPDGWTSLGANDVALQNIGYRACCRIVTEAGRQSATCTWSDDSTFVAEAMLVVFKAGLSPLP